MDEHRVPITMAPWWSTMALHAMMTGWRVETARALQLVEPVWRPGQHIKKWLLYATGVTTVAFEAGAFQLELIAEGGVPGATRN